MRFPRLSPSGPLCGFGVPEVGDLATLPAPAGTTVKTHDVKDCWYLDQTSALTPDGITVIQGLYGQWIRQNLADPSWAQQANWYINALTGKDTNDGSTALLALKTWAEFRRRMQFQTIVKNVVVHVMSDLPEVLDLDLFAKGNDSAEYSFSVQGDPSAFTALYSGTLDSTVTMVPTTNTPPAITVAGIVDWNTAGPAGTSLIGACRIRLTNSADAGAVSFPLKRTAATVARCGVWHLSSSTNPANIATPTNPVAGTAFVAEQLPGVYGVSITLTRESNLSTTNSLWVSDLNIGKGSSNPSRGILRLDLIGPAPNLCTATRCIIGVTRATSVHGLYIADSLIRTTGAFILFGRVSLTGCAVMTSVQRLGIGQGSVQNDTIFQGAAFTLGDAIFRSVGFFDAATACITTGSSLCSNILLSSSGTNGIWGSGNAGSPVVCTNGNYIKWAVSLPTITGSAPGTNDITYGATAASWAALNAATNGYLVDATRLCGFVK